MDVEGFISVIIGGLYAITLISITIFSIVGNIIQKKTMGMSPSLLIRYKIFAIFSPLYILTMFVGLMIFLPYYNTVTLVFILSVDLILLISVQSYYILEPFYDLQLFKQTLVKKQLKSFRKKIKKLTNNMLEKEVIISLKKLDEYKDEESFFEIDDVKNIWNQYLLVIKERNYDTSVPFKKELIQICFMIFDNEAISILKNENFIQYELLEKLIGEKLHGYNREVFEFVFDKLYDLFEYYKKNNISFHKFNDIFIKYARVGFLERNYLNLLAELLFNDKWNISDAEYISLYYKNMIHLSEIIDYGQTISDEILRDKINYVLTCFDDKTKFSCKFGEVFDEFLKSCFILIRKESSDD